MEVLSLIKTESVIGTLANFHKDFFDDMCFVRRKPGTCRAPGLLEYDLRKQTGLYLKATTQDISLYCVQLLRADGSSTHGFSKLCSID